MPAPQALRVFAQQPGRRGVRRGCAGTINTSGIGKVKTMKTILCFIGFSLTGWICLFMGFSKTRRYSAKVSAETLKAEGVIIGYEEKQKSAGRGRMATACYPVVRFTVDSREYVSTSEYCRYKPVLANDGELPPEGSRVTLYCNPQNPYRFHLAQDVNDEGQGLIRIAKYIIAISAVASAIIGMVLKW